MSLIVWRLSKKCRAVIAAALFLLISIPLLAAADKWANAPNGKALRSSAPTVAQATQPAYRQLRTTYFATVAPDGWRVQITTDPASAVRLHVIASAPSDSIAQAAIVSDALPPGGLGQVADYHLRVSEPAQYPAFSETYFPAGAKAFRDAGGTDYTIFFTHGGRFVSLSVSGEPSADATLALMRAMIAQWAWA